MAFIKKIWKDRISQFPNRRTINDGNVTKQVTVGRDEGAITEEGDAFDASNMNDLEQRIEDAYGDVQGLVAAEVAQQYDSANVIFDEEPTEGHGTGYTVTSEGIKTAIDSGLVQTKTVSGSIVHITDGADNIPVKSLTSEIVAVESGSGEKSPENPYTISGFDSGVVSVCGVNLWDEDYELGFWNASGVFSPNTSGYMSSKTHIPVKPNTSICVVIPNNISFYLCRYDKNKNFIDRLTLANPSQRVVQMTSKTFYITFSTYQAYGTTYNNDISINYPSTDIQYHAYNGNTYTFTFGQTVYGGHFDNKGNLVVNGNLFKLVDNNNIALQGSSVNNNVWRILSATSNVINNNKQLCNIATYNSNAWQPADSRANTFVIGGEGNLYLQLPKSVANTLADFITYITDNDVFFYHEMATPTTLSITSQDIPTLLGENNIFSNCGDVEVTYYVDTDAIYAIRDVIDEFAMQSDWNEADNTKADYIKNKPTIPANADFSLSGLSDTDISSPSAGQVLTFDGDNWVNSNIVLPSIKYEEINVTFDASGEGTLFNSVKFVVGLKDIPSDQLYVGYVSYIAGSTIKIKALSRTAIAFSSQNNVSSTRKVGVYYLDNIATP